MQKIVRVLGEVLSQILNVPVVCGSVITFLLFRIPSDIPNRISGFSWTLCFLSLIPLCSLFFYIPGKTKDPEQVVRRQRIASFVFMAVSYPLGFLVLRLIHAPKIYEAMAATYTLVTLGLIVFNLLLHYKASGHAAGIAGPIALMIYIYGLVAAPLLALWPLVSWSRVAAEGHTPWQTVVGGLLSLVITLLVLWMYGFLPLSGIVY